MEDQAQTSATTENQATPRDEKGRFVPQNEPPKNVPLRDTIRAAFDEQRKKAEPATEKPQAEPVKPATQELPEPTEHAEEGNELDLSERSDDDGEVRSASPDHDEEDERKPEAKPQASKTEPPLSWTKEGRAQWDSLPPSVQKEVLKREADTQKGVEKLKETYRDLEESVAPYKGMIQAMGRTPGAAIKGLFDWQMALAGPNKEQAFKQLAANLGVNLQNLVTDQVPQPQVPGSEVPPELKPVLDQYASKISLLDQEVSQWKRSAAEQQQAQANSMIEKWSADKPHFAAVRELMGQLINSDLALVQAGRHPVGGFVKNGNIDLDRAYEAAIYAHPEVRSQILAEQASKTATATLTRAKTEVKGAKKAGVSVKPTAPTAPLPAFAPRKPGKPESVRQSILRAMSESQG